MRLVYKVVIYLGGLVEKVGYSVVEFLLLLWLVRVIVWFIDCICAHSIISYRIVIVPHRSHHH